MVVIGTDTTDVVDGLLAYRSNLIDGFVFDVNNVSFEAPKTNTTWSQTTNIVGTQNEIMTYLAVSPGGVDSLAWLDEAQTQMVHMDTLYGPDYYYDYFERRDVIDLTYFDLFREVTHDVHIQAFASNFGGIGGDRLADIPNVGGGSESIIDLQADLQIRFTEEGQKATRWLRRADDTLIHVPFEVWDMDQNRQLVLGVKDNNKSGGIQDTTLDNWENTLDLDWVAVYFLDYATHADSIQEFRDNPNSGWAWQFNDASKFTVGDVLDLSFLNPVKAGEDRWLFSPSSLVDATKDEAKEQLDLLNVFPNPYFAFNVEERAPLDRFVTFTHLPEGDATIRIYSLGGHFVRVIDHGSTSFAGSSFDQWNLTNNAGIPVASGMYIVHIEIPDVGDRFLKLAIFQPEERLDVY